MNERDWLADQFEENRTHLRAVAYRMPGSPSCASTCCARASAARESLDAEAAEPVVEGAPTPSRKR